MQRGSNRLVSDREVPAQLVTDLGMSRNYPAIPLEAGSRPVLRILLLALLLEPGPIRGRYAKVQMPHAAIRVRAYQGLVVRGSTAVASLHQSLICRRNSSIFAPNHKFWV